MSRPDPPVPPERFETERLVLRRPVPADAGAVYQNWARDPDVTRYLTWTPHDSPQEAREHVARCRIAWHDGTAYIWGLEDREQGELVGELASRPGSHGVNLGYVLGKAHWGRGFMVEALEPVVAWWLSRPQVFRVWAVCDVENAASARVLEKAGFQLEGTLRRWERHPNLSDDPRDALCYSRVRNQGSSTRPPGDEIPGNKRPDADV